MTSLRRLPARFIAFGVIAIISQQVGAQHAVPMLISYQGELRAKGPY